MNPFFSSTTGLKIVVVHESFFPWRQVTWVQSLSRRCARMQSLNRWSTSQNLLDTANVLVQLGLRLSSMTEACLT